MYRLLIALLIVAFTLPATAQKTESITTKKEKSVTVDVDEDNGKRKVKVIKMEDGDEQVIKWEDEGEIPEDIKALLKKEGINVTMLEGGDDEREIEISVEGGDHGMIFIESDGNGLKELEWDGEGEMPEEMKELMEEHDIDIESIGDHSNGDKEVKVRVMKTGKGGRMHKAHKGKKKIKMRKGRKSPKMMWVSDDENSFSFGNVHSSHMSNAYMGAHIETTDEGVKVLELIKDSPADKANLKVGDVIQRINGARTKSVDNLMSLLGMFEPNDKVEIEYLRDGQSKQVDMTLAERPDHHK